MQINVTCWLDETVKKYPEKIGFIDVNRSITFSEIKNYALKTATALIVKNLFKKPIAIYMDKSVDELITFFGVAYSGNFYSPIDVDMPNSRIQKILEIFEPEVIITKKELWKKTKFDVEDTTVLFLEDIAKIEQDEKSVYLQRDKCCDTDLLYVLFTSGSTGIPKGVTICHQSVIDYIDWVEETFSINSDTIFGNQAPFYFDNSVLDIYTTVKTGALLYLIPQELFSWPIKLLEYLEQNKINTIFWVPSAMILVSKLKALTKVNLNGKLKKILFCGEVMPNKHLNIWRKYIPDATYANLYGPTEITDVCTYYIVDRTFGDAESLPIGKALMNTDILILNEENQLVGNNEIGELCVRGTSLSKGYYKNVEKTRQVFIQNPLNPYYIELIYRTGDLVKVNEFGEILYMGRKDFQIKHMGHRIELGEIETAISSIENISMNCCLYDEKKCKIIVFIEGEMSLNELNKKLENLIPEYMLPNKIIIVEKMPLNQNGKIDRTALKKLL